VTIETIEATRIIIESIEIIGTGAGRDGGGTRRKRGPTIITRIIIRPGAHRHQQAAIASMTRSDISLSPLATVFKTNDVKNLSDDLAGVVVTSHLHMFCVSAHKLYICSVPVYRRRSPERTGNWNFWKSIIVRRPKTQGRSGHQGGSQDRPLYRFRKD
jgi:hypothetical protein